MENELLNELKSKRDFWNNSLIESMKEHIQSEASIKILDDIIAEVEFQSRTRPLLSLNDIVQGMRDYCEIVYHHSDGEPKCEECPFSLQKLLGVEECMMKLIEQNIKYKDKKNE